MKLVVRYKDNFVNIAATSMQEREGIVFAYNGDCLVGAFDLGYVDMIWLSEPGKKESE